jgi:anti-sigma B factor antagonist
MKLEMVDLGGSSKIVLEGRLDTPGVGEIETRFTASVVARGRNAIIDLSQVSFVSSMGIRMLLTSAKSLGLKKARMVMFGAPPLVRTSLEHVGLPDLIPLVESESDAVKFLEPA